MKFRQIPIGIVLFILFSSSLYSLAKPIDPVNPDASPEARALLQFLSDISGRYTLTGQHNFPNVRDRNSQFAAQYTGKTPAVFSTDMGFARDGDTDSYLARPDIVEESKRQHAMGSIILICWHAVPPTADEPVTFRPQSGPGNPDSLATVQGQLKDEQFRDVLTPGTPMHKRWCAQVDSVAFYLKKLRDAHVPILWRPYHEMNGSWFWWGGRHGRYSTAALYRQMFDRYIKVHKLNNLIWVWSVDRPNKPEMHFSHFYPGKKYLDVLSLDVYRNEFNLSYYDSLVYLAKGKPIALAEVGNPPALDILRGQPRWTMYVIWAGMVRNTAKKQHLMLVNSPRILSKEDPAYWELVAAYRDACGLPSLPLAEQLSNKANFSGEWILNEEKSIFDVFGAGFLPYKFKIVQQENDLSIEKSYIVEYADDRITEEKMTLDGTESISEMFNSPRIMTAKWSAKGDTLIIESRVKMNWGGQSSEMVVNEDWSLQEQGKSMIIRQIANSPQGERKIIMFYDRR